MHEGKANHGAASQLDVDHSYKELGLSADASDAEIKAAWRRLAARWHPDRNQSPAALRKIQRINRALEEIRQARRMPDGVADAAQDAAATSQAQDPPERPIELTVDVTLEEALAGCVKHLQGEVVDACGECHATGLHTKAGGCPACEGTGKVRQQFWFLWASAPVECGACQGHGMVQASCGACEGTGQGATRKYRCRVRIPAGTRDADVLESDPSARSGEGTHQGAITARVRLQPHEFFTLDEDGTVRCELPVDGFAWVANRWIEVPTPSGLQQMRLSRGHLAYRIKGQGFPAASQRTGKRADCIVTVVPQFPQTFDAAQEAQIDRLIETNTGCVGTAASKQVSAWDDLVDAWQARLP